MASQFLANPLFESPVAYKAETIPYPKAWITLGISLAFLSGIFCATIGFTGMPFAIAGSFAGVAMLFSLPMFKMPRMFALVLR